MALGRDPLTGDYRQVSRTVHGGKRKAQAEIARIVAAASDGRHRDTKATGGSSSTAGSSTSRPGALPQDPRGLGA